MSSINFNEIYSRFLIKIEGYDLFNPNVSEKMRNELLCSYVHSAIAGSYVRRLFSSVVVEEPYIEEIDGETSVVGGVIEYSMKNAVEDVEDDDFVKEMIAYGMALAWVEPKVNSSTNLLQLVGTSDEKWYSQSNHLSELRNLREDLIKQRNDLVRDRGLIYNSYLSGDSSAAKLRSK